MIKSAGFWHALAGMTFFGPVFVLGVTAFYNAVRENLWYAAFALWLVFSLVFTILGAYYADWFDN